MKKEKLNFEKDICECCGQSTNYIVGIDKGTAVIMKKIARAIKEKGINCVHLAKENVLEHNELCNIIRPRYHGLVAHAKGETGNFVLTQKGFNFLAGHTIPKYAVVNKKGKFIEQYFKPEEYLVRINDFNNEDDYWEGVGFTISQGRVISDDDIQGQLL